MQKSECKSPFIIRNVSYKIYMYIYIFLIQNILKLITEKLKLSKLNKHSKNDNKPPHQSLVDSRYLPKIHMVIPRFTNISYNCKSALWNYTSPFILNSPQIIMFTKSGYSKFAKKLPTGLNYRLYIIIIINYTLQLLSCWLLIFVLIKMPKILIKS